MPMSKRSRAIWEAEARAAEELQRKSPPVPLPPWTASDLKNFDRIKEILDKVIYSQMHDIDSVSELLGFSYLLPYSVRIAVLKSQTAHYRELTQGAAKEKLWEKIHGNLYGLTTEVHLVRKSRERGGTGVQ